MGAVPAGCWNRRLGWALIVAGFAAGAALDPWSLSERDPAALLGSSRMALRYAQAVVIAMGFLQLITAVILDNSPFSARAAGAAAALSAIGTVAYAAGYVLAKFLPPTAWLIVAGALLNFLAFALLSVDARRWRGRAVLRVVLFVFCFGMAIDAVMGLFAAAPGHFLPQYLAAEDGVRQRMLRLARAAVIALSLLTLLFGELAARAGDGRVSRWGQVALLLGAAGMPATLAVAAFTAVEVKYLLGIPAQATFLGTLAGAWLAWRHARPLEVWGWLLIAVSMQAGLFMGLYAFDGPLPSPLGDYNEFARRLSRLGHAYCIVLGLAAVFLAREMERGWHPVVSEKVGGALLAAASVVTVVLIAAVAAFGLPTGVLGVGPALVAVALVVCLLPADGRRVTSPRREGPSSVGQAGKPDLPLS
jgi:hypothetical protein